MENITNIIRVAFGKQRHAKTKEVYRYAYGQKYQFVDIDLPVAYTVYFSNSPEHGESTPQVGDATGVLIPDAYLQTGLPVYAFIFLHAGEDDGATYYTIETPVIPQPEMTSETPDPVQQSAIDDAIAALNAAVQLAEDTVEHYPQIVSGYWVVWDVANGQWVNTGVAARGPQGETGPEGSPGPSGQDGQDGQDGVSPTVSVETITGGHRVSITDADRTQTFDVMDGEDYVLTEQDKSDIAAEVDAPVQDVQVNGTSIVNAQGVANVPIADDQLGVVKIPSGTGLYINPSNGELLVSSAGAAAIIAGTDIYRPIAPARQHESAFYGLAKVAGVDLASETVTLGTYPDAAKVAIQKMLGLYREWELIADVTVAEDAAEVTIDTDTNGQAFELVEMLTRVATPPTTTGTRDYIKGQTKKKPKTATQAGIRCRPCSTRRGLQMDFLSTAIRL